MVKKYYKKYEELIKYLIFGVLTTLVSLGVYYLCTLSFLSADNPFELQIANIISFVIAVTFAYITNRKYVFKSKTKNIVKEVSSFFSSRIVVLIFDMLFMFVFVTVLKLNDQVIKIVDQVFIIVLNYILSKFLVFRRK